MKKLNVAIIGQGRSGRNIHGLFLQSSENDMFNVVAVVDRDPARRELALKEYPGCKVYEEHTELFGLKDIDLVVNSTFSHYHYCITKDLLLHDFNVLVEKPMGRTYYECCDLMKIAKERNRMLAVYHQSLFAPMYTETKKMIATGKLGDIQQISLRYNGLGRRWDWQTTQFMLGGSVYNTGPHPIGYALGFWDFPDDYQVAYSKLACLQTSGDAEDYAKILLTSPGKPVIDIEISEVDAFSNYTIKVQGSKGTYCCNGGKYWMKYIPDGENPEQPLITEPLKDAEGMPSYCRENLITREEEGDFTGDAFGSASAQFYRMMYKTLTTGEPLEIKPEYAAKVINIIETVHGQNPMPVKY